MPSRQLPWLKLCRPKHHEHRRLTISVPSQDIDGDSDDDIPELEEQGGGDDSAEVCSPSSQQGYSTNSQEYHCKYPQS